jgi:hypothetical protein
MSVKRSAGLIHDKVGALTEHDRSNELGTINSTHLAFAPGFRVSELRRRVRPLPDSARR